MRLKNVRDMDDKDIPAPVREKIQQFVRRGHDRNHLVINEDGKVFFDHELAENDAFNEVFYGEKVPDE